MRGGTIRGGGGGARSWQKMPCIDGMRQWIGRQASEGTETQPGASVQYSSVHLYSKHTHTHPAHSTSFPHGDWLVCGNVPLILNDCVIPSSKKVFFSLHSHAVLCDQWFKQSTLKCALWSPTFLGSTIKLEIKSVGQSLLLIFFFSFRAFSSFLSGSLDVFVALCKTIFGGGGGGGGMGTTTRDLEYTLSPL